jgi:hypothetical protein
VLAGRWGIILLAVPDKGAFRLFNKKEQGRYFLSCADSAGNMIKHKNEQAEKSHCSLSKYYGKKFFMHHLPA